MDDREYKKDEKQEDCEDIKAPLVPLSNAVSVFLEMALGTKQENKVRVAKARCRARPTLSGSVVPRLTQW